MDPVGNRKREESASALSATVRETMAAADREHQRAALWSMVARFAVDFEQVRGREPPRPVPMDHGEFRVVDAALVREIRAECITRAMRAVRARDVLLGREVHDAKKSG